MTDTTFPNRPFRRSSKRASPVQPDPADCGTAYGMEISMALQSADLCEAPTASGTPVVIRRPAWWRRLGAGRGPATA